MTKKRALKDWLSGFLEYTEHSEPPAEFRLWTGISTICAALERKCWIEWLPDKPWYPNMYILLVAPSGVRKGTAMAPGEAVLKTAGVKIAPDAGSWQGMMQAVIESNDLFFSPSGEAISHSSLTFHADEFTVLTGQQDDEKIMILTTWYDCGDVSGKWEYRSLGQGKREVHGLWVNILGGTTPTQFSSALPASALDGFTGRLVLVYADQEDKEVPFPFLSPRQEGLFEDLVHDLDEINQMSGPFTWTQDLMEIWGPWYLENKRRPPFSVPFMKPYIQRRPVHAMKVAMALSASRNNQMVVTGQDLEKAISMLETIEPKMPRAFGGYGSSTQSQIAAKIMDLVAKKQKIKESEILATFYADLEGWRQLDDILDSLSRINFLDRHINGTASYVEYRTDHELTDLFG